MKVFEVTFGVMNGTYNITYVKCVYLTAREMPQICGSYEVPLSDNSLAHTQA